MAVYDKKSVTLPQLQLKGKFKQQKKYIIIMKSTLLGLAILLSFSAAAQSKISPNGEAYMQRVRLERQLSNERLMSARVPEMVKAIITLSDEATVADLEGYNIDCVIGDKYAVVDIAVDNVNKLAELDAVNYISFGTVFEPCLDMATADTGVDQVHAGEGGLPKVFNGEGVIAAAYDIGIDPNHAAFRDEDGTTYRIKRYYNTNTGMEYTPANMANASTDNTSGTHGTHVAGIITGIAGQSGYIGGYKTIFGQQKVSKVSGTIPFGGVAPKADIALAGGALTEGSIISYVKKIIDYAKSEGKPVAINCSFGHMTGPHDGSNSMCRAMDELAKDAVIVFAAGNDADIKCSIRKTLSSGNNAIKTFISPQKTSISGMITHFWLNDNGTMTAQLAFYRKSTNEILSTVDIKNSVTYAGTDYTSYPHLADFTKAFSSNSSITFNVGLDSNNNRSYITIGGNLKCNSSTNANGDIVPLFIVKSSAGKTILATTTEEFSNLGLSGYDDGTCDETISDSACGKNIIAVGAYNARKDWLTLGDGPFYIPGYPQYEIAKFSSYGTTNDGRNLPHITAPGVGVISAFNSYYYNSAGLKETNVCGLVTSNGKSSYWGPDSGTSMAAPFITGVACLMLQADPTLTVEEIRNILMKTATKDEYVNAGNPIQWGAGKVNALDAVREVLGLGGVGEVFADEDMRLIVNPTGSKNYDVFLAGVDNFNATLYNLSGSAVKSAVFEGNEGTLDASALSSGIYLLEVKAENAHFTQKIVIK